MNKEDEQRALDLHKKSIVIDGLVFATGRRKVEYLGELTKAGVTAGNVCINKPYDVPLQAMKEIRDWHDTIERHSDKLMLVTRACDVERAKKEGKFGVIMGTQNADILEGDLDLLLLYRNLGLRVIQLSYYRQNLLGEGCGERTNGGLSMFGIEVVEEMNRLGLLIDVSHCKDQVTMDAIKYSKGPIIISHSNARRLVAHIRNKTDEQIKALAEKDGVIGLTAWSLYCKVRKGVRPTFEDLLDMIDYVVKLVGPEHVGLGLDLTPFWATKESYEEWAQLYPAMNPKGAWCERSLFTNSEGHEDVSLLPEITKGLVARGYSEQDIKNILGINFLRVLKEVVG